MAFETTVTVPTLHLREFMSRMARAGFTVLDTGERVSTDEGFEAEATVRLLTVPTLQVEVVEPAACELGIPR